MSSDGRLITRWDPVEEVWLHWPECLDGPTLERARGLVAALCGAFVDFEASGRHPGVKVRILIHSDEGMQSAKVALAHFRPSLHKVSAEAAHCGRESILFWKRQQRISAVVGAGVSASQFEGIDRLVRRAGIRMSPSGIAFERGSLETDGEGTAILNRAHWLRPGWNQNLNVEQLHALLAEDFGLNQIIWIDRGLVDDPELDYVHRVVRFAGPGKVLCQVPADPSDPHARLFSSVRRALEARRTTDGQPFEILDVPAPLPQSDGLGRPLPLSHLGFLHVNGLLIVPVFDDTDHLPLRKALQKVFPEEEIVLHRASLAIEPGGSFNATALTVPA